MTPRPEGTERFDAIDGVPAPAEHVHLFGHGQEADALAGAFDAGRSHHAIMLAGPAGIGKGTLAFRLAYHILSAQVSTPRTGMRLPDVEATTFRQIAQDAHPSFLYLSRPPADRTKGFKSAITVDEIRRVGRFVGMTAHDGGHRVVIVDPADDMNRNAANALLKTLEEPPARTIFILTVHSPGRLLPTIRSRCHMVKLKPLEPVDLLAAVRAVCPSIAIADGSRLIAEAQGSVRDALLMALHGGEDVAAALEATASSGRVEINGAYRLADAVAARDGGTAFQLFNSLSLQKISSAALHAGKRGERVSADKIAQSYERVRKTIEDTQTYNLDRRQHVLATLAEIAALPAQPPIDEVR